MCTRVCTTYSRLCRLPSQNRRTLILLLFVQNDQVFGPKHDLTLSRLLLPVSNPQPRAAPLLGKHSSLFILLSKAFSFLPITVCLSPSANGVNPCSSPHSKLLWTRCSLTHTLPTRTRQHRALLPRVLLSPPTRCSLSLTPLLITSSLLT